MPLHFVCPSCNSATPVWSSVPELCPHCQAPLPATLRASLEQGLVREQAPLPFLLMLGRFGAPFIGGLFALFFLLAPFNVGTYFIGEEQVTGPEFLRRVGFAWGMISASLLAIGYALWTERWWGRWLMLGYWLILGSFAFVTPGDSIDALGIVLFSTFGIGVAAWYLFAKENVVRYYKSLERQADAAEGAAKTPGESA